MKFTTPILLALAGFVVADSSQTAKEIADQAKKIQSAIESLDKEVKAYSGDSSKMTSASNAIGSATKEAQSSIQGASPLTLTDALGIQAVFNTLQNTIDTTMTDLISIKSKIIAAGQGCEVTKQLNDQQGNANSLAKLIVSKVPTEVKVVAETLAGNVGEAIVKAKTAYADACSGGSGGGSAGGSSSSSGGMAGHDMSSPSGSGSGAGSSSSGSGASSGSSASSGAKGSKTSGSTTSTAPKPAVYTGAASSLNAPVLGALAMGAAFFAL